MAAVSAEVFLALEASLTLRLSTTFASLTKQLTAAMDRAAKEQDWDKLAALIDQIDLAPVFDLNEEYIRYLSNVAMLFGASRVTGETNETGAVTLGFAKDLVDQVMASFRQMLLTNGQESIKNGSLSYMDFLKEPTPVDGNYMGTVLKFHNAGFNEAAHPRVPAGSAQGGEFTDKAGPLITRNNAPIKPAVSEHTSAPLHVPEGTPEYGKSTPGSVSVLGIHYSAKPREYLTGMHHGQGLKDAADQRLQGLGVDQRLKNRIYFYVDEGHGVVPEAGVGGYRHTVLLKNMYDPNMDHGAVWAKGKGDSTASEKAVLDAGYDGYYVRNFANQAGVAVLLGDHTVKVKAQTSKADITEADLQNAGLKPPDGLKRKKRKDPAAVLNQAFKSNPNHEPAGSSKGGQFAKANASVPDLPPEPGTAPVKEGYVRLYHQTDAANLDSIKKNGITIEHAKGIEGPRAVYAGETPFYRKATDMPTIEFQVPKKEWDAPFVLRDVKPSDFLAVHEPWHKQARYLEQHKDSLNAALAGEYDDLTGDYKQAVAYVKEKHGTVKKGENDSVLPFSSFVDSSGRTFFNIASSLHTSRLSAYGYTAEAEYLGVTMYKIDEQLDARTCPVCEEMNGKTFKVSDARNLLDVVVRTQDADELKALQPWPSQSKAGLEELKGMTNDELVAAGWHVPPFHPRCRGLLSKAEVQAASPTMAANGAATTEKYLAQAIDFNQLGVHLSPARIDKWNQLMDQSPAAALAGLMGSTEAEVTQSALEAQQTGQDPKKSIGLTTLTVDSHGTINIELQRALSLAGGDEASAVMDLYFKRDRNLFIGSVELSGSNYDSLYLGLKEVMMDVYGTAQANNMQSIEMIAGSDMGGYALAKYGLATTPEAWANLKLQIARTLDKSAIKDMLTSDEQDLLDAILASDDPKSVFALADMPSVGEALLAGTQWAGYLDLTDPESIARFLSYIAGA